MDELEESIAPSTDAAAPETDPSALAELRFDPDALACDPRITAAEPGAWETAAPRNGVSESAPLKLRDTEGSADVSVTATVTAPDDSTVRTQATVTGGDWAEVEFPGDFPDASLSSGAYTVVWTTGEGVYIACDGFVGD